MVWPVACGGCDGTADAHHGGVAIALSSATSAEQRLDASQARAFPSFSASAGRSCRWRRSGRISCLALVSCLIWRMVCGPFATGSMAPSTGRKHRGCRLATAPACCNMQAKGVFPFRATPSGHGFQRWRGEFCCCCAALATGLTQSCSERFIPMTWCMGTPGCCSVSRCRKPVAPHQ